MTPRLSPARLPLGALASLGLLASCGGGATSDLSPTLLDITTQVIYPTYASLASEAQGLNTALGGLCAAPTEATLAEAQGAWRAARAPWRQSLALNFGPAEDERLDASIAYYPIDEAGIEALIASDTALTIDYVQNFLGSTKRGLSAVEYLIFEDDGEAGTLLSALGSEPRRCELLLAYGGAIAQETLIVRDGWGEVGGGGYSDHFAQAGEDTSVYLYSQNALDHLTNQLIQATEVLADSAFALPLGLKAGTPPNPEDVESHRSNNALAEASEALAGIDGVLEGGGGLGLLSIIEARSPGLEGDVRGATSGARGAIEAIPGPLDEAILEDPATVEAAFDAVKELQALLKVDVAGALGVVVTFSDNDGD